VFPVSWGMGKMTRGEFITRLEELNPDVDYKKVLKFFERQTSKRPETNKEVLRNSWVFDVAWHIYHGHGTTGLTKSVTQRIKNYVADQHYKDNYKVFHGHDWLSLRAIQNAKKIIEERGEKRTAKLFLERFATKQHVKNCNAILQSKLGKRLMKDLIDNGGYFFEVDGQGPEYLRNLKEEYSDKPMTKERALKIVGGDLSKWGLADDEALKGVPQKFRKKKK
jgi:hypothetical protein